MTPDDAAELVRELATMIARRDQAQREFLEAGRHVERIAEALRESHPAIVLTLAGGAAPARPEPRGRRISHDGKLTLTAFAQTHGVDRRRVQHAIATGLIRPPALTKDRMIVADLANIQLAELDGTHTGLLVQSAKAKVAASEPGAKVDMPSRADETRPLIDVAPSGPEFKAEIVTIPELAPAEIPIHPFAEAGNYPEIPDSSPAAAVDDVGPNLDVSALLSTRKSRDTVRDRLGRRQAEADEIAAAPAEVAQPEPEPACVDFEVPQIVSVVSGVVQDDVERDFEQVLVEKGYLTAEETAAAPKNGRHARTAKPAETAEVVEVNLDRPEPPRTDRLTPPRICGLPDDRQSPDPMTLALRAIPAAQVDFASGSMTAAKAVTLLRTRGYEILPQKGGTVYRVNGKMQSEEELIARIDGILAREERSRLRREQQGARP